MMHRVMAKRDKDESESDDETEQCVHAATLEQVGAQMKQLAAAANTMLGASVFGTLVPFLLLLSPLASWSNLCAIRYNSDHGPNQPFGEKIACQIMVHVPYTSILVFMQIGNALVMTSVFIDLQFTLGPIILCIVLYAAEVCGLRWLRRRWAIQISSRISESATIAMRGAPRAVLNTTKLGSGEQTVIDFSRCRCLCTNPLSACGIDSKSHCALAVLSLLYPQRHFAVAVLSLLVSAASLCSDCALTGTVCSITVLSLCSHWYCVQHHCALAVLSLVLCAASLCSDCALTGTVCSVTVLLLCSHCHSIRFYVGLSQSTSDPQPTIQHLRFHQLKIVSRRTQASPLDGRLHKMAPSTGIQQLLGLAWMQRQILCRVSLVCWI